MSLLRRLDQFWFARYDPLPATLFRLGLGVLIFGWLVAIYPNWERFYGADGVLSLNQVDPEGYSLSRWSVFTYLQGVVPVAVVWWLGALACVALILGLLTPAAALALLLFFNSVVLRNPLAASGEEHLFRTLLFFSCFAPLGARFSLDARLRGRLLERKGVPAAALEPRVWAVRLLQINVALVFLFSAVANLVTVPAWREGSAAYYALLNPYWGRLPWHEWLYGGVWSAVLTWLALAVQAALPLLIWFRRLRLPVALAGLGLMLATAVSLSGMTFFALGLAVALVLFFPAGHIRELVGKPLRLRLWRWQRDWDPAEAAG